MRDHNAFPKFTHGPKANQFPLLPSSHTAFEFKELENQLVRKEVIKDGNKELSKINEKFPIVANIYRSPSDSELSFDSDTEEAYGALCRTKSDDKSRKLMWLNEQQSIYMKSHPTASPSQVLYDLWQKNRKIKEEVLLPAGVEEDADGAKEIEEAEKDGVVITPKVPTMTDRLIERKTFTQLNKQLKQNAADTKASNDGPTTVGSGLKLSMPPSTPIATIQQRSDLVSRAKLFHLTAMFKTFPEWSEELGDYLKSLTATEAVNVLNQMLDERVLMKNKEADE